MWSRIVIAVAGVSSGCAIAVAELSLINAIGVYPRLAVKTKTGKYLVAYENIAGIGMFLGSIFSLYAIPLMGWGWLLPIAGFFIGCFVGNLIMGLAEIIDVFPVLFHRARLKTGLSTLVFIVAVGKMVGSFCYFLWRVWNFQQ